MKGKGSEKKRRNNGKETNGEYRKSKTYWRNRWIHWFVYMGITMEILNEPQRYRDLVYDFWNLVRSSRNNLVCMDAKRIGGTRSASFVRKPSIV